MKDEVKKIFNEDYLRMRSREHYIPPPRIGGATRITPSPRTNSIGIFLRVLL